MSQACTELMNVPHNIFMQIQYKIRDYDRLRQLREDLLQTSAPPPDGMPRSHSKSDPTGARAIRLAFVNVQLDAIESSAHEIARGYAKKVRAGFDPLEAYRSYDYFCEMLSTGRNSIPSRRTWNYYKVAFSRRIAEKLYLI